MLHGHTTQEERTKDEDPSLSHHRHLCPRPEAVNEMRGRKGKTTFWICILVVLLATSTMASAKSLKHVHKHAVRLSALPVEDSAREDPERTLKERWERGQSVGTIGGGGEGREANQTVGYRLINAVPDPKLRVAFVVNGLRVVELQFQEFFVGWALQQGSTPIKFEAYDVATNRSFGLPLYQAVAGEFEGIAVILRIETTSPLPPFDPQPPVLSSMLFETGRSFSREPIVSVSNNVFSNSSFGFTNSSSPSGANLSASFYASPSFPVTYLPNEPGRDLYVWLLNYVCLSFFTSFDHHPLIITRSIERESNRVF